MEVNSGGVIGIISGGKISGSFLHEVRQSATRQSVKNGVPRFAVNDRHFPKKNSLRFLSRFALSE